MTVLINNQPYEIKPSDTLTLTGTEYIQQQTELDKLKQDLETAYAKLNYMTKSVDQLTADLSAEKYSHRKTSAYVSTLTDKLIQPKSDAQLLPLFKENRDLAADNKLLNHELELAKATIDQLSALPRSTYIQA